MAEVSFGEWLRRQRNALGLTQEQLARQISCSTSALRKLEAEERRPSTQTVEQLAEIFNISSHERAAFLRFARGDWGSAPHETAGEMPWHASSLAKRPRSNLPAATTSLIGREQEIALVRNYLAKKDTRLVTLIGPPGIGKTRLSLEVAHEVISDFSDGVFFVALAPLDDPALIGSTIVQALGYVETKNLPTDKQLMNGIGDKHMLLVLDNCEHLIENVSSLVAGLLSACSRLKILTTSRESLRILGEWLYAVPAFAVPESGSSIDLKVAAMFPALTLFAERACAVRSDFTLNADNIQVVATICAQLDGLPLAIELIAARMRLMSSQVLLERLNDRFILHADGMRPASARQKTLNDAIGWSYNLLSAGEQKLFAYLSVFSGSFTLEAAEAILSRIVKDKSVSDFVTSLLDKSLLQRVPDREPRDEPRYTMLATIQEFARERLRGIGQETEARHWHLAYFLDLAEKGDAEIRGPSLLKWLQHLGMMRDNFRAALHWAIETEQTEAALQMTRKLHWLFFVRGDHSEGRQWLGRVLAMPEAPLYPQAYAEGLTQIAHHTWLQIGPKEARPFVEQALAVARAQGDKWNIANALSILGLVLAHEHNYSTARGTSEESMALFRELDDQWRYAHAVLCLAQSALVQEDYTIALALHQQALELFRKVGDLYFQSAALRLIGYIQVKQGDWSVGQAALRQALILAQQFDGKHELALGLWSFGYAALGAGNPARAVRLFSATKNHLDLMNAWQQVDNPELEDNLATCRAALSEAEFAEAVAQGRALTLDHAIELALQIVN